MIRSTAEWIKLCEKITAGYVPNGGKADTFRTRLKVMDHLHRWGLPEEESVLIDLGCGNGRLAMGLVAPCEPIEDCDVFSGVYHGVDILKPCIDFCQNVFAPYPNFHFHHLAVKNDHYWNKTGISPATMRLPFKTNSADLVVCHSLFTHLAHQAVADHYLYEIWRVLRPGGKLLATWFTAPPWAKPTNDPAMTVFTIEVVDELYKSLNWIEVGRFGGDTRSRFNQHQRVYEKGG